MDVDDLHAIAYRISGLESISALTGRQAGRMIDELKMRAGEKPGVTCGGGRTGDGCAAADDCRADPRPRGSTSRDALARIPAQICRGDDARFMTTQQASRVIDGLKAMRRRRARRTKGGGERRVMTKWGAGHAHGGHQEPCDG